MDRSGDGVHRHPVDARHREAHLRRRQGRLLRDQRRRASASGLLRRAYDARMPDPIDYLNPGIAPNLPSVVMPVVDATTSTLEGFGRLVSDPRERPIEIVQWPSLGSRPVDAGTG